MRRESFQRQSVQWQATPIENVRVDEGQPNLKPTYARQQSVSLGEYHPIKLEQLPRDTEPGLERSLRVMVQFKR